MSQQFWVPHPTEVWGVAVEVDGQNYKLWKAFDSETDPNNLVFTPKAEDRPRVKPVVDPKGLQGLDNICDLSDVTEASLLQTLRQRYKERQIYTNVGRIVLSLNPFEYLPLYGETTISQYMLCPDPYTLQPHIYQVSAAALQNLSEEGKPQAALITGESGAGKTETTKLILQFLAVAGGSDAGCREEPEAGTIQQRVLEANPVLEAFGNASTSRNPNSSRFGKWIEVMFSEKYTVTGARITSYLLEVPRVVGHAEGERNYHVFYQILEGLKDSIKGLQGQYQLGTDPAIFKYLQPYLPSKTIEDAEGLEELKHALQTLGFRAAQQNDLFSVVAAVLHLGNVAFIPRSAGGEEGSTADPTTAANLSNAAALLGIPEGDLLEILVTRSLKTGNEVIRMALTPAKAVAARDGFAQLAYSCLFSWLIARVNESLQPTQATQVEKNVVGILDIAGFESFKNNGFEQLCINLSNEKLQHHFNQDIFLNEISDYKREGLHDLKLAYTDNADVLDLIEGKGGIFATLDEELFVPKGSEQGFVAKLAKSRANDKRLIPNKASGSLTFTVCHYAGNVIYNADGWLQKDQNALPADAVNLLLSSSNEILVQAVRLVTEASATQNVSKGKGKSTVGVMEAVRIRKAGFALRLLHADFVSRYGILMGKQAKSLKAMQPKDAAEMLVAHLRNTMGLTPETCLIGASKVFCKDTAQDALESNRRLSLAAPAILIQKHVRGFLVRRRVAEVLALSRQLRVFVEAMEEAKRQGGSFLSPAPVFSETPSAQGLKQKSDDLHILITKCEALGPTLEPPVLSKAKRAFTKMNNEALVTLKLESAIAEANNDVGSVADLLLQAQDKGISNATTERAEAVVSRLEAEHALLADLAPALESRDSSKLKKLTAEAFRLTELSELINCAQKLLTASSNEDYKDEQAQAELETSLTKAQELQKMKSARTLQQEILRQTVETCVAADKRKSVVAINSLTYSKDSSKLEKKTGRPIKARPRDESPSASEWSDSDSEDDGYYSLFQVPASANERLASEGASQRDYMHKYLSELTRATTQCDAKTLEFLLSRASEAGISSGQREVLVAEQQLRNLADRHWLECELKECVILFSWGSVSSADVTRLSNLIKQALVTPGVNAEILQAAEATKNAVAEPEFSTPQHDDPAGLYSLETYPDLAINIEMKRTKSASKVARLMLQREALLSFQSDVLTEPLLELPDPLKKDGLVIFRKLQCLMGDRFSVGHNYSVELIKTATACEPLRDEMYVQLLKQLRRNTNNRSVLKGFGFLATLCEHCPPSPALERYVRQALEVYVGTSFAPIGGHSVLDGDSKHKNFMQAPTAAAGAIYDTELQSICARGLRALEENNTANRHEESAKIPRKSIFEFQIFLADGSRRRVPLGLQATAESLCRSTASSLNIHNSEEWVKLMFRRPYLRLRENIVPHPAHSRLTCQQAVADYMYYPLEEPPELVAEIAAKIWWLKVSAQNQSTVRGGAKWLTVAEHIPVRLQGNLPPHRWVALFEQYAQDLEPDEGELVFGGSFFLCDPFELKLCHIEAFPEVFAAIAAAAGCSLPSEESDSLKEARRTIQDLIDNSLHTLLMREDNRGASKLPRLLCPPLNFVKMNQCNVTSKASLPPFTIKASALFQRRYADFVSLPVLHESG
ncbi:myosin G, putative [Eimeria tenella]|uniref:Myosin G, putative n=1 Tax=Eimeria tenella TaxID=5802 RepID=U6KMM7_EIMTE|nr:myosin G, putative [Eimeria tenella]CDJ39357.1 myosin G, putative [Eimeria tenella]|eukprot:XP_013230112.1 myosin G, putative [Eimeria tenella]